MRILNYEFIYSTSEIIKSLHLVSIFCRSILFSSFESKISMEIAGRENFMHHWTPTGNLVVIHCAVATIRSPSLIFSLEVFYVKAIKKTSWLPWAHRTRIASKIRQRKIVPNHHNRWKNFCAKRIHKSFWCENINIFIHDCLFIGRSGYWSFAYRTMRGLFCWPTWLPKLINFWDFDDLISNWLCHKPFLNHFGWRACPVGGQPYLIRENFPGMRRKN